MNKKTYLMTIDPTSQNKKPSGKDVSKISNQINSVTGFKEFESAQRTLAGIEIINIIRKDQLINPRKSWFATFKSLAA